MQKLSSGSKLSENIEPNKTFSIIDGTVTENMKDEDENDKLQGVQSGEEAEAV